MLHFSHVKTHFKYEITSTNFVYVWNSDNHPSCDFTTNGGRQPAAGENIRLTNEVLYARAREFKPIMTWKEGHTEIIPDNNPPEDDGQATYTAETTYTLPRKSKVQVECHTSFDVQNTHVVEDATNNPSYKYVQTLSIDVKGQYQTNSASLLTCHACQYMWIYTVS